MSRLTRVWGVLALGAMVMASTACGYALAGRGTAGIPANIRRIGIPDCLNQSGQPDVDRTLTDAIRTDFSGRGKYTVLPQATGVDAVLTCTITGFFAQPTDVQQGQAVAYRASVTANIEFHDLTNANKTLWANPAMNFSEPYNVTNSQLAADATTSLRQNSEAMDRLAKNFARTVVSAILENF